MPAGADRVLQARCAFWTLFGLVDRVERLAHGLLGVVERVLRARGDGPVMR